MADIHILKLYTITELSQFGIGTKTLYRWAKAGYLQPSTYAGSNPRYKYQDFEDACRMVKAEKEAQRAEIATPKKQKRAAAPALRQSQDFYEQLTRKYIAN